MAQYNKFDMCEHGTIMENCSEDSCRRKLFPTEQELAEDAADEAKMKEQQEKKAKKISNARQTILFCSSNLTPEDWKPAEIHDYVWAFGKDPDEAIGRLKELIAENNYSDTVNAILGGHVFPVVSQHGSGGGSIVAGYSTNISISSSVRYCAGGNPASMIRKI